LITGPDIEDVPAEKNPALFIPPFTGVILMNSYHSNTTKANNKNVDHAM
jgi:hypothetical protein